MSPFVQKALKLTLKSVASLLVILFISLLLLVWRLSSSPIQLNQFVPRIEQAASALPGGLSVRLKGIGLFLNRAERHIDLRALNVELVESSGTSLVSSPEVDISLSVFALLRGVVAISSVELQNVDVQLVRREDGTFQVFRKTHDVPVVSSDSEPKDFSGTIQHLFKTLASDPDTENPFSYLKGLKIKGSLEVEDRKSGLHWVADTVDSLFVGHKGEIRGDLGVTFSSPQALDGIHADITLKIKGDDVTANLEFTGVRPARIASLDQRLAALADLDMSLNGTIGTTLTLPDRIYSLNANIKGGAGQISYKGFYPEPLKVVSLGLQASVDLPGKSLQVSSLDVLFGEAATPLKLHLNGNAKMLENTVSLQVDTGLQQLKVNEFDHYWPRAVAQGARKWLVNNLKAGAVSSAKLDLAMDVPTGPEAKFQLKELKGTVAYSNLTVAYFGSLPPATGVTGAGTFDRHGFDLNIDKGLVNGVSIDSGKVVISGMDNKKAAISVKTHLNGQLAAVFAVLEKPPLNLGSESVTGLVSDQLGGQIESDFSIALPLRSGLVDGDIKYQASGKVTDGTYRKFYRNYNLHEANMDFNLDHTKVSFNGPLAFSGIPLVIDWTTLTAGPNKGHADFTVNSPNISADQISALGYDVSEYMQGSIALKTTAELAVGGGVTASIESDFNNAALAIPQIHWSKAKGDGGNIGFSLLIEKNHLHAKDIDVALGKLKTGGNAEFDVAGSVMSVSLEHLALSYAHLNGLKLEQTESKNLRFTLQGGEASLEPFLSGSSQGNDPQGKQVEVETIAIAEELKSSGIVLEIGQSRLDKVYLNKDTYFDNIQFSGRWDNQGSHELKLSGHNPFGDSQTDASTQPVATEKLKEGQFSFVYGPSENGQYPLHIEAEDLGSLVSAVKGRNIMKGGYLVLDGDSAGPFLTKPIQTSFKLDRFTVKEAPTISKVLNMASLTQIISTFTGTGLAFNSASGDLLLDGTHLSSKEIRMRGGSLGLSASGWTDLKQQTIGLSGTVIPMSKLNDIVGKMPLLGRVVTGKDGHGIMAVDYTVKGTIGEPEVSIKKESLTRDKLEDTLGTDIKDIEHTVTDQDHP